MRDMKNKKTVGHQYIDYITSKKYLDRQHVRKYIVWWNKPTKLFADIRWWLLKKRGWVVYSRHQELSTGLFGKSTIQKVAVIQRL